MMHARSTLLALALLLVSVVHASVYVTNPVQSTTLTAGQPSVVQWTDDGQAPLLSDIGECDVALYTYGYVLVQSLPSANVATTSSFTFTPDPSVGPNGQYYLVFTSSNSNYRGFSGTFTLTGMSGGSSTSASTPPSTPSDSSTSAGSTTPTTTVTDTNTVSTPSGTSTPVVPTTGSTSALDTTLTTPIVTTPTTTPTSTPTTATSHTTTSPSTTSSRTSATSASATPTSAAGRVGSSMSLGGLAALVVLSGVLAF